MKTVFKAVVCIMLQLNLLLKYWSVKYKLINNLNSIYPFAKICKIALNVDKIFSLRK